MLLPSMPTALLLVSFALKPKSGLAFHSGTKAFRRQHRFATFLAADTPRVSISDAYDGGNIEFVGTKREDDQLIVSLKIKSDPYTELEQTTHLQYFSFRSTVALPSQQPTVNVEYLIENAGNTSFARAWEESTVFHSTSLNDSDSWKRKLDTQYNSHNGVLSWRHEHDASSGSVYFCYFPPYSYNRHLDIIQQCYAQPSLAKVESLGQSLDGREIECVTIGTGPCVAWIIHRQHPGEHMAEYYAEGLLKRLLQSGNDDDDVVNQIISLYTLYVVPNMNPDGAIRGYLRTNAGGANLNREWADSSDNYKAPTLERSPEVYGVLQKMQETGCDVFVDVHGDEVLPYNFLAQPTCPNWGPRLESLHGAFLAAYERANSDMQRTIAYPAMNKPCSESKVLRVASSQIAARFDCLSVTLEMPFKDCLSNPDPERGWNPARAQRLGASVLEPLLYVHPFLRTDDEFWNDLPEEDAYVLPTSQYKQQA